MSFWHDLMVWITAIIEHWHGYVSGGAIAFGLELIKRFRDWEPSKRIFAGIVICGLFSSMFSAWEDQYARNQSGVTYVELDTSQINVPMMQLLVAEDYASFSFGRNNSGSYLANDVYGAAALETHAAPKPPSDANGQFWLTNPAAEKEAWEYFLKTHPGPYPKSILTPGRVAQTFTTASSDHKLSAKEIDEINGGKKVLYLVAFVVWTDAAGTHERQRCQFFHFPPHPPYVLEDCYEYNGILPKAVDSPRLPLLQ